MTGIEKRVVFLPDRSLSRPGDMFHDLVAKLGLSNFAIDDEVAQADVVAYIGKERAHEEFGERLKSGPTGKKLGSADVYVLPSTAPEDRRRFFEGVWRNFAAYVLGRDLAVRDEYKGHAPEEVKAALDKKRFPFSVCCANVVYDFNLGSIIRTANAFLAREVWIYGHRKVDLRGAMGSYNYETIVKLGNAEEFAQHAAQTGASVVVLEETKDAIPIHEFKWPHNPVMVFGQEGPGVPSELRALADQTVFIQQHGSIRSLNVGVAAGIAMQSWHNQNPNQ